MQEVIVYRSQAEADFWHALYEGRLTPIIAGIVLALIVLSITYESVRYLGWLFEKYVERKYRLSGKGVLAWPVRVKIRKSFSAAGLVIGIIVLGVVMKLF